MTTRRTAKIGIIGAGSVGATIAYAAMIRGVARQISLYDIVPTKVHAEVLDLNHGMLFVPPGSVEGSDDIEVLRGCDVIVMTAGAKQRPGQTRIDLAAVNASICAKLLPRVVQVAPDALLLLVTNPVDVITQVVLKVTGLPAERVFGSGTVLDSSRFRFLIAERCSVAVQNVHAYITGEHGDSEFPLWSSASIGSVPVRGWKMPGHGEIGPQDEQNLFDSVRTSAEKIIEGKGATNYAIGLAVSTILQAILWNEGRVLPVSSLLADYRGISDICLSVPSIVGHRGVEGQLPIPMNDAEVSSLHTSAEAIRHVISSLGF